MIISIKIAHCFEQQCTFVIKSQYANSYDDPMKSFYSCDIIETELFNENDTITTNTANNRKSNDDVTMLFYKEYNDVKFIPNEIFTTFPNLEYFWIAEDQHFATLKANYLKNAHSLKVFHVTHNEITKLSAHIFAEAANLKYINLCSNKIETIHKSAFVGLPKLKGVLLDDNRIRILYPSTFSHLKNLYVLELRENICVNKLFENANKKFDMIEYNIRNCNYTLTQEELAEIEEAKDAECDVSGKLEQAVVKFSGMIEKLQQRIKILEEKVLEMDNKILT